MTNTYTRKRKTSSATRVNKQRETPLPIYIGLYLHAKTRKKVIIDQLYQLGLSVSYKRVMELSNSLASNVSGIFQERDVVFPLKLHKAVFTTAAIDNIDHNCSSTTSTDSFHGTGISLFQHPAPNTQSEPLVKENVITSGSTTMHPLPEYYTNVLPMMCKKVETPPPCNMLPLNNTDIFEEAMYEEER